MSAFKKFTKLAAIAATTLSILITQAQADALDDCRHILMSGAYTLKYENVTPPTREAMHEKKMMISGKGLIDDNNPYTMYKPMTGIVISNGNDRYIETNTAMNVQNISITKLAISSFLGGGLIGKLADKVDNTPKREYEYATCKLTKGDELFIFSRITNKDEVSYVGKKKGKVEAVKILDTFTSGYPYDFGDTETTRLLNAMMPNDKKVEGTIIYERVKSGTLSNGLYYVDFKATNPSANTFFDAIRYYFQNNKLVKIEAGQYFTNRFGKPDGIRTIINVHEFSNSVEKKYLELPTELEDVTKRNNDVEGEVKK